jgi:hypothetical protein
VKHRFLLDSSFGTSTRSGNALPIADASLFDEKGSRDVKSGTYATSSYYDALARAEHRARSAEQRLAAIERMLTARRSDDEILATVNSKRSLRRRLVRAASQTISLTR